MAFNDQNAIRELLLAAAKGPFFPDWEFPTLFGCSRSEVAELGERLPSDAGQMADLAIGNALNNMLRYPHGQNAAWSEWLSVSRDELEELARRWPALQEPLRYYAFGFTGQRKLQAILSRIEFTTERAVIA